MSYLKFDKNLMINLEQSLTKEILRTNQSGGFDLEKRSFAASRAVSIS